MQIDIKNEQGNIEFREDLSELKQKIIKSNPDIEQGEVKDITNEEYNDLCLHETLTDEETQQVVKFSNKNDTPLVLGLTSMTDNQTKILSNAFRLELNGLTSIPTQQLEILSKKEGLLALDGLKYLTDTQAALLSRIERLHLNGLEYLTDKQVSLLLSGNVEILELNGLKGITDTQAILLSKSRNPLLFLHINDNILTSRQRKILGRE